MRFVATALVGLTIVELEPHHDERGFFARSFCEREFEAAGLPTSFPQSNLSRNARSGTMRGMHFNRPPHEESKLVRCTRGAIYDVAVDLRPDSPTRLDWFGVDLDAESGRALFVPAGFAHGFVTLVDDTDVSYKMGASFMPEAARGFRWDDPAIAIAWPMTPTTVSDRDAGYPDLDLKMLDGPDDDQ